ncbi:hypothetical protein Celaphus_00018715, partial [Cervus elaphus hippelaphus]
QFCGVLGHTFMEFLKGSGDYCQAQHDLYADKNLRSMELPQSLSFVKTLVVVLLFIVLQALAESDEELLTASNFCIWRSIVLKCGCASKTPMGIETTVAFSKTR